ncbi:MAG: 2-phospho-L-lactate transferase [Chloroflexi bacterium]|nr:2-phospho-L-lactate transferase [Chloroflexota bacterium]
MSASMVALAGGVGGAKLAHGLAQILEPEQLTVVVNTADDFQHLGLAISPDLDTVMYTLAGIANPETGWGIRGDTFEFLGALGRLGGEAWFRLGDRDLATHVERSRRLWAGESLTQITRELSRSLGVGPTILPMTDEWVRTIVETDEGDLEFQDYFVRRHCEPRVTGFHFKGLDDANPTREVMNVLEAADAIIICPSNPFVSVDPILNLAGVRDGVGRGGRPVVAVSPIVGGQAIKGPAAKMLAELDYSVSALAVAEHYRGLITGFVLDNVDAALAPEIESGDLRVLVTDTVMKSDADRARLAREVVDFVTAG